MNWLAVFIGGGLGSMSRFGISKWLGQHESGFPTGTFLANVLACVVLGLAWEYFSDKQESWTSARMLILVGFCGGFSTFSTFSLETLRLIQDGNWGMAILYVGGSIAVCIGLLAILSPKAEL